MASDWLCEQPVKTKLKIVWTGKRNVAKTFAFRFEKLNIVIIFHIELVSELIFMIMSSFYHQPF